MDALLLGVRELAASVRSSYRLRVEIGELHAICVDSTDDELRRRLGKTPYVCRLGTDGKPLLFDKNGLAMFAYDNLDQLFYKAGFDYVGERKTRLLDEAMEPQTYYFSPDFWRFVTAEFEAYKHARCRRLGGDDDMTGNALDGATTRHRDYPGAQPMRKRAKCVG